MLLKRTTVIAAIGVTAAATAIVAAAPAIADTTIPGTYNTVAPTRVLDTRSGLSSPKAPIGVGKTLTFKATTPLGSASVSAVYLSVTVLNPQAAGYITAFRGGTARPSTSNINFAKGRGTPNAVVAQVGSGGTVNLYNGSSAPINVIAGLSGYWTGGTVGSTTAGALFPVVPTRLADSRAKGGKPLAQGVPMSVQVAGKAGIPADATGVLVNLAAASSVSGYVVASSSANAFPDPNSIVNFAPGGFNANLASVPLNTDGTISLLNRGGAPADYLVDAVAYITHGADNSPTADGAYLPSDSYRIGDTRLDTPIAAAATRKFSIIDPELSSAFKAVVVNVTALPRASGYLISSDGTSRPSSNLVQLTAGITQAGLVVLPLNADGTVSVYNGTGALLDVVVDVHAFIVNSGASGMSDASVQQRIKRAQANVRAHSVR